MKKTLTLYSKVSCLYCVKVLLYASIHGIPLKIKTTFLNKKRQKELIDIGGKYQVPCLVVDNKDYLYESDDIIQWLKENKDFYHDFR